MPLAHSAKQEALEAIQRLPDTAEGKTQPADTLPRIRPSTPGASVKHWSEKPIAANHRQAGVANAAEECLSSFFKFFSQNSTQRVFT